MADIYLNTNIVLNETYDQYGNLMSDYSPVLPYQSSFRLRWQLYTNTPDADGDGKDMSSWTKANFTGCAALLTCDNDFVHRLNVTLSEGISSGSTISTIALNIGTNQHIIPATGFVTIFNDQGGFANFLYESVTFSGTTATLQIGSWTADANYASGGTAKISQEPYFQSYSNAELSNPATGLFVFDVVVYSRKLAVQGDAAGGQWIDCQGMELLPFKIEDEKYIELPSYLCRTAKISVNMGEAGTNPVITPTTSNMIASFVYSLVSGGLEVQGSTNGSTWIDYEDIEDFQALRWFRFRISGSSAEWSAAVPLIIGPQGTTPHIGANGHWYIGDTDTGVVAEGQDGITPHIGANGHWYIGETDTGIVAELSGNTLTFTSVSSNTVTFAGTATLPVGVLTNSGHYYPIEKGSLTIDQVNNTFTVDVTPYLAYDNSASFSGTWKLYLGAGTEITDSYNLSTRMTAAESAIETTAGNLSELETEARTAWNTAIGQIFGVSNVRGTYAAEIIGYEEDNGNYILILAPDNEDLDLSKFTAGDTVTLSLCTGITSTDPETSEATTAYTLTDAVIASVDDTNKKIYLTASLYQGDITNSTQIGYDKRTVSGYTGSATGGPSSYRVTLSGAGSDDDLRVGRKIYTRAGTGALTANSIAGTSGNYLYLSSAAAGTNAIYLGPSNVYLSNRKPEEDDNTIVCAGEYNFVSGEANSVSGSYNTVVGTGSDASGSDNIVIGYFSLARGEGNRVSGGASLAIGTNNIVSDSMSVVIGQGNKLLYQGQFALGSGNTLTAVNAFAFGWQNKMYGYGTISVGSLNTVSGKNSFALGYHNTVAAESAYVIGRYANVEKSIENKNALIVHGGSMSDNGDALAVRSLKAVENPRYVPGSTTEEEFVEETAYSTEYRGRLKAVELQIGSAGTAQLDHDRYARWVITASGSVVLSLENWGSGDIGEVVVNTAYTSITIPQDWIVDPDFGTVLTSGGIHIIAIRKETVGNDSAVFAQII